MQKISYFEKINLDEYIFILKAKKGNIDDDESKHRNLDLEKLNIKSIY